MAEEVIVFDCDDEPELTEPKDAEQMSPPPAATNPYENEYMSKRFSELLKLRKLRVKAKQENNQYRAPQEEPSPERPKPSNPPAPEVIIFNLEEEPSQTPNLDANEVLPAPTAKFQEFTEPLPQNLSHAEIFLPSSSELHSTELMDKESNLELELNASQDICMGKMPEAMPSVFTPKRQLLNTAAEFRVERVLLFPQKFHLYIDNKHFLTARRKIIQSNSLYFFFSSPDDLSTRGSSYLGRMEANFNGTEYNVFSNNNLHLAFFTHLIRKDHQTKSNLFFPKTLISKGAPLKQRVMSDDPAIVEARSRQATYNSTTKTYSLNFRGRAKLASVKNCIIDFGGEQTLIMGKIQEKLYNLDFGVPFSELTAFAFAISNYEDKLGDNAKY